MSAAAGTNIPVTTVEEETNGYDIYVGITTASGVDTNTFKSLSLDNVKEYGLDDYQIFVEDNKLFIEAGSDYAASLAVSKLIARLDTNKKMYNGFVAQGSYKDGEYTLLDNYSVKWSDEFDGTELNTDNWNTITPPLTKTGPGFTDDEMKSLFGVSNLAIVNGKVVGEITKNGRTFKRIDCNPDPDVNWWLWCDGEVELNTSDSYSVSNGLLTMNAKSTETGYTGVDLRSNYNFTYGLVEARIMLGSRDGAAASFWARSKDKAASIPVNEFDLFENFGSEQIKPNLHTWKNQGEEHIDHYEEIQDKNVLTPANGEKFSDTFHYIAMEWSPTEIKFYLDGELYMSQNITDSNWDAFREETFLIFGLTAPSAQYNAYCDTKLNPDTFNVDQKIDFVRIYQLDGQKFAKN